MRRRQFIAGLGSAAAWPVWARAQQAERVRRIGVLLPGDENDPEGKARISAFTQALTDLGWTNGRNSERRINFCGFSLCVIQNRPPALQKKFDKTSTSRPDIQPQLR